MTVEVIDEADVERLKRIKNKRTRVAEITAIGGLRNASSYVILGMLRNKDLADLALVELGPDLPYSAQELCLGRPALRDKMINAIGGIKNIHTKAHYKAIKQYKDGWNTGVKVPCPELAISLIKEHGSKLSEEAQVYALEDDDLRALLFSELGPEGISPVAVSRVANKSKSIAAWLRGHGVEVRDVVVDAIEPDDGMVLESYSPAPTDQPYSALDKFYVRRGTMDKGVIRDCYGDAYFNRRIGYGPNDVVMDCGANIGGYSVRVSQAVRHVFGYEPDRENFILARKNLERNARSNYTLTNAALIHDDSPFVEFHRNNQSNRALHTICEAPGLTKVRVPAVRFSYEVAKIKPTIIKMDIEGAEWNIFRYDTTNWSSVRAFMMEWHQTWLKDKSQEKFRWVVGRLKEIFDVVDAQNPGDGMMSYIYAYNRS
jgi:FkbM family methyltransferase